MNAPAPSPIPIDLDAKGGTIFICYRRSDSSGYITSIREMLAKKFKNVFLDLEIGPGTNFVHAIRHALKASGALLVIIGPDWLSAEGADGRPRLLDPEDYVKFEIESAIKQGLKVIPVLVGGARMPSSHELPESLQEFAKLQAFELSSSRWKYDLTRLIAAIRPTVDPRFVFRRVCAALLTLAAVVAGAFVTVRIRQSSQLEQAIAIANAGRVDEGLQILQSLEGQKILGRVGPKVYWYEAEIYQMKGDAFSQHDAAEKAIALAVARGDTFVEGRARGLACDAEFKLGLANPEEDCVRAEQTSIRAKDPQGQVRAINFEANILAKTQKPDEALSTYQRAQDIARASGFGIDQYGATVNIGLIFWDRNQGSDHEEARTSFEDAKQGFAKIKELGEESNVYNVQGALNLDQGEIDTARNYFQKALELATKGNDQRREAQARVNLGLILELNGSLEAAETQLVQASQIYEKLSRDSKTGKVAETGDIAEVKHDLGDIYLLQANYEDARKSYRDAERIRAGLHQNGAQALSAACLVNVDFLEMKSTEADLLSRIDTAIEQATNAGDSYSQSFAHIVKARVLLTTDIAAAETEAREALTLADDNQADNAFSAKIILAEIEARKGNTQGALVQLEELKTSAVHDHDVGQELEAQLATLKVMSRSGSAQQRRKAKDSLQDFAKDADVRGYRLLAAQAS